MSIFRRKRQDAPPQVRVEGDEIIVEGTPPEGGEGSQERPEPVKYKMPKTKWA